MDFFHYKKLRYVNVNIEMMFVRSSVGGGASIGPSFPAGVLDVYLLHTSILLYRSVSFSLRPRNFGHLLSECILLCFAFSPDEPHKAIAKITVIMQPRQTKAAIISQHSYSGISVVVGVLKS